MYFNRSSLSDGINKKTVNNRYRITLSARAGSSNSPIQKVYVPLNSPSPSQNTPKPIHTKIHTETLPTTTLTSTTSTTSTTPQSVQVNFKLLNNDPLPDQYFYSEQDGLFEYYDEISIPSSTVKPLTNINQNSFPTSSLPSSNSLSQSSISVKSYALPETNNNYNFNNNNNNNGYKMPNLSESRYDQSTLKSYFKNANPTFPTTTTTTAATTRISTIVAPTTTTTTTTTTSTEKSTSTVKIPTAHDYEVQRQKILSYIISENQPSSFKAPSTTTTEKVSTNANYREFINAFVNTQTTPDSTTLDYSSTSPLPKSTILLSREQPIRLTLSSNLESFNKKPTRLTKDKDNLPRGSVEEIPLTKSRQPSLHLKPIDPTTYSPLKPFRFTQPTTTASTTTTTTTLKPDIVSSALSLDSSIDDEIDDPESLVTHSRRRPYVNDLLSSTIPTRFPPRTTTEAPIITSEATTTQATTTQRSVVQTFTSRGLVFKEILNKTFEPQIFSKPIVSPYISLETQRLTNAIRTTTPRVNLNVKKETSTTTTTSQPATFRSYFLITAPPKINNSVPSTYLFPESVSTSSTVPPSSSPLVLSTIETSTTENGRGKYRPFSSFSSPGVGEEVTTYSPRARFTTRTSALVDYYSTSEQPVVRRKVVRLKTASSTTQKNFEPVQFVPQKTFDAVKIENLKAFEPVQSSSTERVDVTTYTPKKNNLDGFVPSQSRNISDFRPILSKLNEFISKLSYSGDIFGTTSKISTSSYNNLAQNDNVAAVVEVTEKPFYQLRNNFNNNNNFAKNNHETSTKKFRATVEMPEMKVPLEIYDEVAYDEEEKEYDINHEAHVDVEILTSSTPAPLLINTTYSSLSHETTTSTLTTTTTTTTTKTTPTTTSVLSTSTTTNPKSLIPPRATRINNAIKSSIIAGLPRRNSNSASIKCNDVSSNAKCNEIPSRYYVTTTIY
jgi:hypothetical protein